MAEYVDGHPDGVPVPRPGSVLMAELERSRTLGLLGPGPVEDHVEHARIFVDAVPVGSRVVDLGAGGGVPGLVLAELRPDLELVLLDAAARRCEFLRSAVSAMGVEDRVRVVQGRAEVVARSAPLEGWAQVVVARSFGPPAATAECSVRFLRGPGAVLLVSEPEGGAGERWPQDGLAELGLEPARLLRSASASLQELIATGPCPDRYPRRDGVPARRPLF